jgi:phage nucleotide-binding protein
MVTKAATNGIRNNLEVSSPDEISPYLSIIVYGPPGVGKTVLAGTAEDSLNTAPVLIADIEGGTRSIRKRKNIDVVRIRSTDELVELHRKLATENDGYYKTCVIDSLTELQKLDMVDIMRELISKRPDLDPDVPSQREWGKSIEHMRRIVRGFRDLPMNTIFTALVIVDKDNNGNITYTPSLPGKLKMEISGFVDVVGYMTAIMEDGVSTRRIQFAQTQRVIAKDRTASLGDTVDNPTIPMLWELMHNNS